MIKIGNVSFLNSYPFQYGLDSIPDFEVIKLVPSAVADALEADEIDVGLVPIAVYLKHKDWYIESDYCIGALGQVKTVLIWSKKPIEQIETIAFDFESRSSNMLAKVLCKHYWKIEVKETTLDYADAFVQIGDKTFHQDSDKYPYCYDLAQEWYNYTHLPFVFAAWVANKKLPDSAIALLNKSLRYGIEHIEDSIVAFKHKITIDPILAKDYLSNSISYVLDSNKRKAISLFAELSASIP